MPKGLKGQRTARGIEVDVAPLVGTGVTCGMSVAHALHARGHKRLMKLFDEDNVFRGAVETLVVDAIRREASGSVDGATNFNELIAAILALFVRQSGGGGRVADA